MRLLDGGVEVESKRILLNLDNKRMVSDHLRYCIDIKSTLTTVLRADDARVVKSMIVDFDTKRFMHVFMFNPPAIYNANGHRSSIPR